MTFTHKPLHEQVLVITGASSGIGLATARAAARQGSKLVLVSRNEDVLQQITREITENGGEAIHVVADVGQRTDLQRAADVAVERFGGFDTWVNNAGVSIYGRLEEVSDDDSKRLFQTNFWGVVFGSLVALKHLKPRGGALINLGSEVSDHAIPLQGMYSASKHAVEGFTDALRIELLEEEAPVSVTLIKPAAIDTPYTRHAKNYLDEEPSLPAPIYAAEEVARAILFAATHAKRDIFVGSGARAMSAMARMAPRFADRMGAHVLGPQQRGGPRMRDPEGALHHPGEDGRISGGYPGHVMRSSLYTRAAMHPAVTGAIALSLGAAAYAWARHARANIVS